MDAELSKSGPVDGNVENPHTESNPIIFMNEIGELSIYNPNDQNKCNEFELTVQNILPQKEVKQNDDDLANLLISWKLYDQLYEFFKGKISDCLKHFIQNICI